MSLNEFMQMDLKRFEPSDEDIEKMLQESFEEQRSDLNNYSYWFPKVEKCGYYKDGFKIALSRIYQIDFAQFKNFVSDETFDLKSWKKYCDSKVKSLRSNEVFSIKNGTFSNKFDFSTCTSTKKEIHNKLREISYVSMLFGAKGNTEFVVRDLIPFNDRETMTIYNGMPLRTEFRVFYNFDTNKIEHIHNYWDFKYCYPNIRNANDKVIFAKQHNIIEKSFQDKKAYVCNLVDQSMKTVSELTGIWSIDIMFVEEKNEYYLIDMAIGKMSAYWNSCVKEMEMRK